MRITSQRPNFQGAVKRHPSGWHKARATGHGCKKKAEIVTLAYFPAKYGLRVRFTQDADEAHVTQRVQDWTETLRISMNSNHRWPHDPETFHLQPPVYWNTVFMAHITVSSGSKYPKNSS